MNRTIIFIRHGETIHDRIGKFQRINSPLSSKSKKIALRFLKSVKKIEPSVVIRSALKRSIETANLLFKDMETSFITNELFNEIKEPNSLRGKNISPELSFLDKAVSKYDLEPNYKVEDSESLSEFIARVKKSQDFLLRSSEKKTVISSHGLFMRIFLLLSLFSPEMINSELIQAVRDRVLIDKFNCSLFSIKGDKFILEKWNISLESLVGKQISKLHL
ncbi:MAG: phosphoglycerate mutase family protein [Candidatus Levybacteria bacterium]|nr:phosphoglycerate mutase family protein [Candidatus Levybacteria bacterium]